MHEPCACQGWSLGSHGSLYTLLRLCLGCTTERPAAGFTDHQDQQTWGLGESIPLPPHINQPSYQSTTSLFILSPIGKEACLFLLGWLVGWLGGWVGGLVGWLIG